jgi:hypothetical protein
VFTLTYRRWMRCGSRVERVAIRIIVETPFVLLASLDRALTATASCVTLCKSTKTGLFELRAIEVSLQQVEKLSARHGSGEEVALTRLASQLFQQLELVKLLYSLPHGVKSEVTGEKQDGSNSRAGSGRVATSVTKIRSILSSSTRISLSKLSEEYPVPKSSIEIRAPRLLSCART